MIQHTHKMLTAAALGLTLGLGVTSTAQADTFGSGANTFTIDFVNVGNAGNPNDAGAGGGNFSSPYGGVAYNYRMGTYEISQDMITKATNLGMTNVTAGAHTGDEPAANMQWYEAAAFVNWLNLDAGYHEAYALSYNGTWSMTLWDANEQAGTGVDSGTNPYRHKDAFYFLPSEDEWYKAAYHQNDGVTANYWDYATGSNTAPTPAASGITEDTAVYSGQAGPTDITQAGGLSSYGTMGQNGNVYEWSESAFDGINNDPADPRSLRGGFWTSPAGNLRSSIRGDFDPSDSGSGLGFRVASIPEPSASLLILMAGCAWLLRKCTSIQ